MQNKINEVYNHYESTHNTTAAREILPVVFEKFPVNSVVDFGAGLCTWLRVARELGAEDILGIDGDWVNLEKIVIPPEHFLACSLSDKLQLERKFDLAICLEVAEHIAQESADTLLDNVTKHADVILWSAAIVGQGGQNHINEQNPAFWYSKFRARGFIVEDNLRHLFWNNDQVEWWYKQNMMIYRRESQIPRLDGDLLGPPHCLIHPDLFASRHNQVKRLQTELAEIRGGKLGSVFYIKNFVKSVLHFFTKIIGT